MAVTIDTMREAACNLLPRGDAWKGFRDPSSVGGQVMTALAGRDATFAILPDHPVPLRLRAHTRTPVPVAVCGPHIVPDSVQTYSEKNAPNGSLGFMHGEEFVRKVLNIEPL